jgi:hypothetical protein
MSCNRPVNPVPSRNEMRCVTDAPTKTPSANDPVRLTISVPSGKSLGSRADTAESRRNRATAPIAPKKATPTHVSTPTNVSPTVR